MPSFWHNEKDGDEAKEFWLQLLENIYIDTSIWGVFAVMFNTVFTIFPPYFHWDTPFVS